MFAECYYSLQNDAYIFSFSQRSHCIDKETAPGVSKITNLMCNRSKLQAHTSPSCPPALCSPRGCVMIGVSGWGCLQSEHSSMTFYGSSMPGGFSHNPWNISSVFNAASRMHVGVSFFLLEPLRLMVRECKRIFHSCYRRSFPHSFLVLPLLVVRNPNAENNADT